MRQTIFQLLIIGLLIHSSTCLAQAQQAELLFNQGISAFNTHNYPAALRYFQQAEQLGLSNKRLPYNLGVTLYKLGDYNAAYEALKRASSETDLAAIAYFNMGLAALKMANTDLANENFLLSYRHANNNEQRQLAQRMLIKLGISDVDTLQPRTNGILSGGLGYNDNVTLNATDDLAQKSEKSDSYYTIYAKLNQPITAPLYVGIDLYALQYKALDEYNYTAINANINYKITSATTNVTARGEVQSLFLDNKRFQNVQLLELDANYSVTSATNLSARYQLSNIDATATSYKHLAGTRQRVRFSSKYLPPNNTLQGFFEHETNDRDDIPNKDNNGIKASFSPTRNKVGIKHNIRLSTKFNFQWEAQYRRSDFPTTDEINTITSANTRIKRQDNRSRANLRLMYRLGKTLWVYADYRYLNNESNIALYDYRSNTISLNLYWD